MSQEPKLSSMQQQAIDACKEAGGVPIISSWGPWMKDCVFPSNMEEK